jgi:hypothetical protein
MYAADNAILNNELGADGKPTRKTLTLNGHNSLRGNPTPH